MVNGICRSPTDPTIEQLPSATMPPIKTCSFGSWSVKDCTAQCFSHDCAVSLLPFVSHRIIGTVNTGGYITAGQTIMRQAAHRDPSRTSVREDERIHIPLSTPNRTSMPLTLAPSYISRRHSDTLPSRFGNTLSLIVIFPNEQHIENPKTFVQSSRRQKCVREFRAIKPDSHDRLQHDSID